MASFSQASMSTVGSQHDPLGLFPQEPVDEMLPEPNQELLSIEDVPLGTAVAEPAEGTEPNPPDMRNGGSGDQGSASECSELSFAHPHS